MGKQTKGFNKSSFTLFITVSLAQAQKFKSFRFYVLHILKYYCIFLLNGYKYKLTEITYSICKA